MKTINSEDIIDTDTYSIDDSAPPLEVLDGGASPGVARGVISNLRKSSLVRAGVALCEGNVE